MAQLYKNGLVIEVNSSSKRGGKYILSELQEATQSYQVAAKRTIASDILNSECDILKKVAENGKREKKNIKVKKKKSAKQKLQKSQTTGAPEVQMSLILLDEVDILFEEDKGFWVAVNSLRLNSKRPIVMTASDPCVNIDGIFEHILMKSPSVKLHAAHIQNVCLSKDVFVNPPEIQTLAMLHHGGIRQSLLTLQFWMNSNAGECDPHGTSFKTEIHSSILQNPGEQASSLGVTNNVLSDNNGTSEKLFTKESEKHEDSMEMTTPVESHEPANIQMCNAQEKEVFPSLDTNVCVHQLCLESVLGLRNVASTSEGALNVLSFRFEEDVLHTKHSFMYKSLVASHCQALGFDIIRCNLESLSPCLFAWNGDDDDSKSNSTTVTNLCQDRRSLKVEPRLEGNEALKGRSEHLLDNFHDTSVFDNEMDEEHQSTCDLSEPNEPMEHSSTEASECRTVVNEVENENQPKRYCIRKKVLAISLEAFNAFLEDMSFLDSELCCDIEADLRKRHGSFANRHTQVIPGVEDQVDTKCRQFTYKSRTTLEEIRGALEVASLEASHQHFHDSFAKAGQQFKANSFDLISNYCDNKLSLCSAFEGIRVKLAHGNMNEHIRKDIPVLDSSLPSSSLGSSNRPSCSNLQLFTSSEILIRKTKQRRKQDLATVLQNMPDANHLNRFSTALDYLPILRNICRNESHRKISRIKRRFYHYFDMVGLNFPQSLIQLLKDDTFSNDPTKI